MMQHDKLGAPFWRFWGACVLANLGDGIRMAAFPLLAASLTSDPGLVALVGAASALPWLITGIFAGSLADRHGARFLLVGADTARVAVLGVLLIALFKDSATIALTAVTASVLGVAETVRDTTTQVVVPRLVPRAQLERANGRMVSGEIMGNEFVGPLVGSALFAAGAALPFVANSAVLAVAVLLVVSLPASLLGSGRTSSEGRSAGDGIRAGLGWVVRHRILCGLIVSAALVALADAAWFAIFVLFVQVHLDAGPLGFGTYLAVGAGGGLLGALSAERMISVRRHRGVLLVSMAVTAMTPALLLVAPSITATLMVVIVTSAGFGVLNVAAVSLRQRLTPEDLLGRVTAAWRTVVLGAGAVGTLCGGVIASWQGLYAPFALSAMLGLLAVLLWWFAAHRGIQSA